MTRKDVEPTFILLRLPEPLLSRASKIAENAGVALEQFLLSALEEKIGERRNASHSLWIEPPQKE